MASTAPTQLPAYIQLRYQESGVFSKLQSDVANITGVVRRDFENMSGSIESSLSRALSAPRNALGSLNLGVAQMREAVQAQQVLARATEETARAARRATEADGGQSIALLRAAEAAEALAVKERRAADAAQVHADVIQEVQRELNRESSLIDTVVRSTTRMNGANDNGTRSAGAHRAAMMNLGQQMQDATIQAQGGASALTIFTQQGSQAAFAMAGLGGRIGAAATVLAGPWGAALFAGTALLGPFISGLFDAGKEADRSASKIDNMADALDRLRAAQGRVTMQQLGYAQADVFEKQAKVSQLDRTIVSAKGNVGVAAGVRSLELKRDQANSDLQDAKDLLKVSQMRADIQAKADAADKSVTQGKKRAAENEREAKAADRAAKAAERHRAALEGFGGKSFEAVQRITEQFDEQPGAIDKAAQATRQLDAIIADLSKRKPVGFDKMIEEANAAKAVVADSLLKPIEEMERSSQRRVRVQDLLTQGHDDEAAALQAVWAIEDRLGSEEALRAKVQALTTAGRKEEAAALEQLLALYPAMKREAADVAAAEVRHTQELARQKELIDAQLAVVSQTRAGLTSILSGRETDFFGDIQQSFKDLQGKRLFEHYFGDTFKQLEDQLRGQSPLGKESQRLADEMTVAKSATEELALALHEGAATIRGAVSGMGVAGTIDPEIAASMIDGNPITVKPGAQTGILPMPSVLKPGSTIRTEVDISKMSIVDLANKTAGAMVSPFQDALNHALGTEFGQMLGGTIQGALAGKMIAGTTGAVLGGADKLLQSAGVDTSNIFGSGTGLKDMLGGAAMGSQAAGIMKSLGIKTSTTGAQIGGALGSFIPGGEIIGSIAGGIIGGLFKHNTTARALVTGNSYTVAGADSGGYDTASGLGDSVLGGLSNIVEKLGGEIGNFQVAIGTRGDEYRVNTTGGSLKLKNGAISFGDDAEAAIAYAIKDAINDGAIKGMRASTLNIIKAGDDLEAALTDAVDWEGIFSELKSYKDPLGAAMDDLDKEFQRYLDLAKTAGASSQEMADLQELYGIKQAEAVESYKDRVLGSLQGLLDDLTTGDNGLSLRDREAAALSTYDALKTRVQAGDTGAYDDYATAAQTLLGIERELFGSQQEYFTRLNEVTDLTQTRIDAETNVVSIAENRDSPFDASGAVNKSIQNQTDMQQAQLSAVNENLGRVLSSLNQIAANGGTMSSAAARLTFTGTF